MTAAFARPYIAAFSARFLLVLQYRAAAVAGFLTQCWWGAIKVMTYAAFYHASPAAAAAPMTLAQVVTYTWMAQAFLTLTPWGCDPDVALAVRTGAVGLDRLRPVDTYTLWYVRTAGWMTSRAVPRAALMMLLAAVALPALGYDEWAWGPPASITQAALFALSMVLVVALSSSIVMLLNIAVALTMNDRGVNSMFGSVAVVLSGNLLPLALLPDALQPLMFVQPFAGAVDIPFRIYSGNLQGAAAWAGIGLQVFWTVTLVFAGRRWMQRVMHRVQMQGG